MTHFAIAKAGRGSKGPRTKRAVARTRRLRCHDCRGFMVGRAKPNCPACGGRRVEDVEYPR